MNIWLSFVPGSAASSIEYIIRTCTDLDCLPIVDGFDQTNGCVTAHNFNKQWHPGDRKKLLAEKFISATDNVFTPHLPMIDMSGEEVLQHIKSKPGKKFYLGPSNETSFEFALITIQKVPDYLEFLVPKQHCAWNNNDLEPWEAREFLSHSLLEWWVPQMQENWNIAKNFEFDCIDTYEIFSNYKSTVEYIIDQLECRIVKIREFDELCAQWSNGQDKIWQDWKNLVKYKQGHTATITGDIIQESIVQYYLRKQGIELKCYGLNTFPNSEELKQYYE